MCVHSETCLCCYVNTNAHIRVRACERVYVVEGIQPAFGETALQMESTRAHGMPTECESSNFPLHKAFVHNVCFSFFLSDWIQCWIKHITECHFVSCSVYHALTTDYGTRACQSELHITISFTFTVAAVAAAASVHLDTWFLEFNYEKCSFSTSPVRSNSFLWH